MKFRVTLCLFLVCMLLVDLSSSWGRRRRRRRRRAIRHGRKALNKYGKTAWKYAKKYAKLGYKAYKKYPWLRKGINGALDLCAKVGDIEPETSNDYEFVMMEAVKDHDTNPQIIEDGDEGFVDLPVMTEDEWQEFMREFKHDEDDLSDLDGDMDEDVHDWDEALN